MEELLWLADGYILEGESILLLGGIFVAQCCELRQVPRRVRALRLSDNVRWLHRVFDRFGTSIWLHLTEIYRWQANAKLQDLHRNMLAQTYQVPQAKLTVY